MLQVDETKMESVGANVLAALVGDKLVLVIDTTRKGAPSSTGKMISVGNTGGFTSLPGGLKGNIYVGKKNI